MNKLTYSLLLVWLVCAPSFAAPFVTLPDSSNYFYWFRTSAGTVSLAPASSANAGKIDLAKHLAEGGTLYVLDPHSGGIAAVPLANVTKGGSLTVDQFSLPAANQPTPQPQQAPTASQPAPAAQPSPPPSDPGPFARFIAWVFGLAVFGGVIWFVRMLVLSKGQPLIDIARKVGVDVPNPDDLPPTTVTQDGKYEPPPVVKVQRVPEDAVKAPKQASATGYFITDDGTSYAVGSKDFWIGRDSTNEIVLVDTSVSRRHAHIVPSPGGVEIRDENSANGVFVNGLRIEQQLLTPGDRVHIGKVPLRFEK